MSLTVSISSVATNRQSILRDDLAQDVGLGSIANEPRLDLGKCWSAINFLFTGTAYEGDFPASFIVDGGRDLLDSEDELVCSPRWLGPAEVVQINDFLSKQTTNGLLENCDAAPMLAMNVYSLCEDTFDDVREELKDLLPRLTEFVKNAALADRSMVLSGPS